MKKILILIIFTLVSMYYTNICMEVLKEKDPIMQEIKSNMSKYEESANDANIIGNVIVPGHIGRRVNKNKSYSKMKKYGNYNETLTVMEEVKPELSVSNIFDKYIEKGNSNNKNVSFVFIYDENIDKVIKILNSKHIPSTIFLDGIYLENDSLNRLKYNGNINYELLSYNGEYDENLFKTSLSYLESVTKRSPRYCYSEVENSYLLNLCSKLKMHTIKPYIRIDENLLKEVKSSLSNSIIISIKSSSSNISELSSVIDYVISKGYDIVSLDNLISEN